MFKKLYPAPSLLASDLASFQRQESIFIALNLLLLALLLLGHRFFAAFWGTPPRTLVIAIATVFSLKAIELLWIWRRSHPLKPGALIALTWMSIGLNLALAFLLSDLTDHEDSPYFVLMVIPILESAFRFELPMVFGVVAIADATCFFWVWRYFERHPPVEIGEYFEAGTTSLMFAIVGVVVWLLVRHLRQNELRLANNLLELQRTRERLLQEEKLAAIGRLSSAIAHEIRNPAAMISSSIATAKQLCGAEKEEMFEIASQEASRLSQLTTDFLSYARPRPPHPTPTSLADTVAYVADACRALTTQKGVHILANASQDLFISVDPGQLGVISKFGWPNER